MITAEDELVRVELADGTISPVQTGVAAFVTDKEGRYVLWQDVSATDESLSYPEGKLFLRDRNDSVPAIAERVGYGNAAAFMKAFTRVQGQGPGAYRRAHRQRLHADSVPSNA